MTFQQSPLQLRYFELFGIFSFLNASQKTLALTADVDSFQIETVIFSIKCISV